MTLRTSSPTPYRKPVYPDKRGRYHTDLIRRYTTMLNNSDNGTPVHIPDDPNCFQFDAEVSQVFPDMAVRSIPNFWEAHQAHARIVAPWLEASTDPKVLDVGSSRGHFITALRRAGYHGPVTAIDNSAPMCEHLKRDFSNDDVRIINGDITSLKFDEFAESKANKFDVICVNYVLQFIPRGDQFRVLKHLSNMVRPGGYLILGHKEDHTVHGGLGEDAHERYIDWRVSNGYSREEIEAKTKALKGSMFPMHGRSVIESLYYDFRYVMETTRFMMFSTLIAKK